MNAIKRTADALEKASEIGGKSGLNCIAELDPTAMEQAKQLDARCDEKNSPIWGCKYAQEQMRD